MSYVESAKQELRQLSYWFKLNRKLAGTDEYLKNLERGVELTETINNL